MDRCSIGSKSGGRHTTGMQGRRTPEGWWGRPGRNGEICISRPAGYLFSVADLLSVKPQLTSDVHSVSIVDYRKQFDWTRVSWCHFVRSKSIYFIPAAAYIIGLSELCMAYSQHNGAWKIDSGRQDVVLERRRNVGAMIKACVLDNAKLTRGAVLFFPLYFLFICTQSFTLHAFYRPANGWTTLKLPYHQGAAEAFSNAGSWVINASDLFEMHLARWIGYIDSVIKCLNQ